MGQNGGSLLETARRAGGFSGKLIVVFRGVAGIRRKEL